MSSSAVDQEDGNVSDWVSDGEESTSVQDLFSNKIFSCVGELIQHSREAHNFDLAEIVKNLGVDDEITIILLVNFIRSKVLSCEGVIDSAFVENLKETILRRDFLSQEEYMLPVLPEDNLLFLLGENLLQFDENEESEKEIGEEDWDSTKTKFAFFSKVSGNDSQLKQDNEKTDEIRAALEGASEYEEPTDYYFGGYSHIGIHETMLRDAARTNAYADALLKNSDFVKDKVVLDVGCGTGILCLLAAKAGAKKVVGVDMSSIIERSKKVVKTNGYDNIITLVRGKLEEITLPLEYGEVDIIVSEWMGYGLYFENMLPAVMYAREKYLKRASDISAPGIVMPSDAMLFIEAVTADTHDDDRVSWWGNVYGFDMTEMTELFTAEAQVEVTSEKSIISDRARMHSLDIRNAVDEDLDFNAPFTMRITDPRAREFGVKAFVISFDVLFAGPAELKWNDIVLSTSVQTVPTHWKQTTLWLCHDNTFKADVGDEIVGNVFYKRSEANERDYVIEISWCHVKTNTKFCQKFVLA